MSDNPDPRDIRARVLACLAHSQLPVDEEIVELLVVTEPARRAAIGRLEALPGVSQAPMAVTFRLQPG